MSAMRDRTRHGRRDRTPLAGRNAAERDLVRLADGTLEPGRREAIDRLLAGSPELQARLREQRRAVAAARSIAQRERAPLAVRMRRRTLEARGRRRTFEARTRRRTLEARARRRPSALGLALGLLASAATAAGAVLALGGAQAGLTVAQAATLAVRPATIAVSEPREDGVTLPGLRAAGLPFPYWEDRFAWRATGARTDRLGGRLETTVFYRRGRELIAYTIVAGDRLPGLSGARTIVRSGTQLTVYRSRPGGQLVLTWLRRGHTCVLSGHHVPLGALSPLAVWRGQRQIPY
jgi:hypothetical protein